MKFKGMIAACALTLCFMAQPVAAGDLEDAMTAYKKGDYQETWLLLWPLGEQGNADAQLGLGVLYANGYGVKQDYGMAVRFYRLAAEQGQSHAQYNLGKMYERGRGVLEDRAEAVKWYKLAAEQGDPNAQDLVGGLFERGDGVLQDFIQAHMWFNLAATAHQGSGPNSARGNRERLAARMTPEQIAEAQKLAREWIAAHPKP